MRKPVTNIHENGINFAMELDENNQRPNSSFLQVLSKFSPKLSLKDKRLMAKHLKSLVEDNSGHRKKVKQNIYQGFLTARSLIFFTLLYSTTCTVHFYRLLLEKRCWQTISATVFENIGGRFWRTRKPRTRSVVAYAW